MYLMEALSKALVIKLLLGLYFNKFRRFTGHLAKQANGVTCVDFIPLFNEVNRSSIQTGSDRVTFVDSDVTELSLPPNR